MSNFNTAFFALASSTASLRPTTPDPKLLADAALETARAIQALRIEHADSQESIVAVKVYQGGRRTMWRETLLSALCQTFGCEMKFEGNRVDNTEKTEGDNRSKKGVLFYSVIGTESDTLIVQDLFTWLEAYTEKFCKWHSKGQGIAFSKQWLLNVANQLSAQFAILREETSKNLAGTPILATFNARAVASREFITNKTPVAAPISVEAPEAEAEVVQEVATAV